ncbi:putative transmembrane Protein [Cryptosporidium felis]|nr:putative transmembrane Protein [Cryptosporidium felis]
MKTISISAFERANLEGKGCGSDVILSDRFLIQKTLVEFDSQASIHLDNESTEEVIKRLTRVDSVSEAPLDLILPNEQFSRKWQVLIGYLKLEFCGGCIEHFLLGFQMVSEILNTTPNAVYLLFIPINSQPQSSPINYLYLMLKKTFYGKDPLSPEFKKLISYLTHLRIGIQSKDSENAKETNYEQKKTVDKDGDNTDDEKEVRRDLGANLILQSLSFLDLVLSYIDNLSLMYDTDFRQTENFNSCFKTAISVYSPILQVVLSSVLMQRQTGRETDKIREARKTAIKILERMVLIFSGTSLLPFLLNSLQKEAVKDNASIFESLMDILSPDFPDWYARGFEDPDDKQIFFQTLELQLSGFEFLRTLCYYTEDTSYILKLFLDVKKHHIPYDKLPEFISKSDYWFSDIKDKLHFDRESSVFGTSSNSRDSLPQYVNSIFSNFFFRITSVAVHNGLKLQRNFVDFSEIPKEVGDSILTQETVFLKKLYEIKIDLFLTNVRILAFIISTIVTISENDVSDIDISKSIPLSEVVSSLFIFLVWICEFSFDQKSKIPQLYHILEDINMIKIRLPILCNAFYKEESGELTSKND